MTKPTLAVLAIAAAALLGSACKEDPKRPPVAADDPASPGMGNVSNGGGTRTDGGSEDDSGDASTACTDLEPSGGIIDQNGTSDDPVAGAGGTIVDGVYELTDARLHQGAATLPGLTGSSFQGAIRFTGNAFERVIVLRTSGGASSETRSSGTFTTNDSNATMTLACPIATQEHVTYTVANTSVTFTNLVTKETFTFTMQP